MAIKHILICLLLIALITSGKEIWIRYEAHQEEAEVLLKYFYRNKNGYFVDLGGYNPVKSSNTVRFSDWNGVVVQANQQRAANIRDFQPHITTLNFAMGNISGKTITFYQAEAGQSSSLSIKVIQDMPYRQTKAVAITMADLCHKYYKAKPNLLNIDIQGTQQMVLRSNDWLNDKCIPDVILTQDDEANRKAGQMDLEYVLLDNNYTRMDRVKPSTLFIHNSKLQFYKNEALANAQYIKNKIIYSWSQAAQSFTKLLDKQFKQNFNSRTNPAFLYLQHSQIISVLEINKYSNYISQVGANRPIIILQYDEKISSIYLQTYNFTVQSITAGSLSYKLITANYEKQTCKIYVLDHQKYNQFNLRFAQEKENQLYMTFEFENMIKGFKKTFTYAIIGLIVGLIVYLWKRSLLSLRKVKKQMDQQPKSA